jgi:phosphoribosyl 1,2-cyclic phosphodiesterase
MTARFTVLASGSTGNASLLQSDGLGVLVDFGLGPRVLAARLAARGLTWQNVTSVLLTHTHSDHWNEATLTYLHRLRIPLYCHPAHGDHLVRQSRAFVAHHSAGLVQSYEAGRTLCLGHEVRLWALPISHDAGATFGIRVEGGKSLFGPTWAIGYAADLGCWDAELAAALSDVDLLALEFNHDEQMQITSGRPFILIRRVLSDEGHLSNRQAGDLLRAVLKATGRDTIRHVVPLHLSQQCNRPHLARAEAEAAIGDCGANSTVSLSSAGAPTPTFAIGSDGSKSGYRRGGRNRRSASNATGSPPPLVHARSTRSPDTGNSTPPRVP